MPRTNPKPSFIVEEQTKLSSYLAFAKLHLDNNDPIMMLAPLQVAVEICLKAIERGK